jgi:hypothetical protein
MDTMRHEPAVSLAEQASQHRHDDPKIAKWAGGGSQTCGLGYINEGGTLNTPGMLFRNRCTWAHALDAVARLLKLSRERVLREEEIDALDGRRSPHAIIIPDVSE